MKKCPSIRLIWIFAPVFSNNQNSTYIKGDNAVPSVKIIKRPNSNKRIIIGNSQNFFLILRKSQNSLIMYSLSMTYYNLTHLGNNEIAEHKAVHSASYKTAIGIPRCHCNRLTLQIQ